LEEDEDGDEKGWFVCAVDIIGFEQAVVTVSDDVWNVSLDISTMLRQGLVLLSVPHIIAMLWCGVYQAVFC